ncbi:MAG: hypothetical protein EHM40_17340 [Chloroflexi bacterium]|nr:MAG: hypothetical protein EHM40_17340 [Chloroflexota bacterium]
MKTIKNEKLIQRNAKIGNVTSLAALAVLGLGMYISFTRQELFVYALIALVLGFTLTQIGIYMGSKFGRSPRPDEKIDAGLKGLQNEFVIYHYTTPVSHLLVGPAGVWVIKPYHQRGEVAFQKNRWRLRGGGFLQGYLRIFGQESLGRPELEIESEIHSLRKYLSKRIEEAEIPEINGLLVFTNDTTELDAEASPIPAMKLKQLKEFMRQKAKEKKVSAETLNPLKTALE